MTDQHVQMHVAWKTGVRRRGDSWGWGAMELATNPITWTNLASLDCGGHLTDALTAGGIAVIRSVPTTGIQLLDVVDSLGTRELGVDEALSGPAVMDLCYDEEKTKGADRPAYFTNGEFPLHTDMAYVDLPPKYLLTLCVRADENGGGVTTLADCRSAWADLSGEDRAALEQPVYAIRNAPNTGEGGCTGLPIRDVTGGTEIWRFRADSLSYPESCAGAVSRFAEGLVAHHMRLWLSPGDLLVLDNHRICHGRTAFGLPSQRHLLRAYAQKRPDG